MSGGAFSGLRVIDFGQWIAGPLTAMLLADQGAEVIRVDPPGGPRMDLPANSALLRGRRHVMLDLRDAGDRRRAQDLVASADVLVENFRPGVMDRLGLDADGCLARNPGLVYCSLPGFGHDDPRAADAAWEGVVMAAAGGYSTAVSSSLIPSAGEATSVPRFSPLPLASVFGALEAAMAITAALVARERDGLGQRIEVPLFDALFEASGLRAVSYERNGPRITDFGSGFYRCADGRWVTFIATFFRHLVWFLEGAERTSWIDEGVADFDRLWTDPACVSELHDRMVDLFSTRPAEEWERLGRAHGCTIGMLRSMPEWLDESHARASGTVVDVDDPDLGAVTVPGLSVRLSTGPSSVPPPRRPPGVDTDAVLRGLSPPARATAGTANDAPPLAGVRVLDLSRIVAGPTAAKLLAQLGADVIKVDEDPARLRSASDMPAFHEHLNRGKRSVALDLQDPADRTVFERLAADSDVVVQNFTAGVAERLGIDEETVRTVSPDVVYLYLNTFGTEGPWAGDRGFAEIANITTGITERANGDDDIPTGASAALDHPRWPFTDYAAGVLGAFGVLVGLYHRARTGIGPFVETSLVRATTLEQIVYLALPSGSPAEPRGAVSGWSPMQQLNATADGWVFVGARSDQLGPALSALGAETESLPEALRACSTDAAVAALRAVGVGVHPVASIAELMAPGGPADRRGLRLEECTDRHGTVVMPGPAARLSRTPMRPGHHPTPFGSDRQEILDELQASQR